MGKQITQEELISQSIRIHNNKYDYSLVEYKNKKKNIKIICPIHGEFDQTPEKHLLGRGCLSCGRKNPKPNKRLTQKQFIERSNKVHNNFYDYSLSKYKTATSKIIIVCPVHGEFEQVAWSHLNGCGCKKCSIDKNKLEKTFTSAKFIEKANQVHNFKYDYSETIYKHSQDKVIIICPVHGIFIQQPNKHLLGHGCIFCTKSDNESKGEAKIRNWLELNNIKFMSQYKFNDLYHKDKRHLLRFDFYLPDYNICIEFDGIQHFKPIEYFGGEEMLNIIKERDSIKDMYCSKNKIKLLRIGYTEYKKIIKVMESHISG